MINKFEKIKEPPVEAAVEKPPLTKFKEMLKGWMTSPDGEDYCPDCWEKYLEKCGKEIEEMIKKTSHPAASWPKKVMEKTRKAADGWYASCEGCKKYIFVPKEEKK
jgi:hypothetical protein